MYIIVHIDPVLFSEISLSFHVTTANILHKSLCRNVSRNAIATIHNEDL